MASSEAHVMKCRVTYSLAFLFVFLLASGAEAPGGLITVVWAPDSTVDGTGTGTLGAHTVTYTTAIGFNAGTSGTGELWASDLGTALATGGSVTSDTRAVLGGAGVPGTTETITFSSSIVDPVLLVNFLGGPVSNLGDTFNFGANSFTLLSSFNAMASGNTVSSTTPTDTANDGFGLRFNGTFGPGTPLQFVYTSNGLGPDGLQTVGFTVGIASVPEPTSLVPFAVGLASICMFACARRRRARGKPNI
jgi:hypothetical protein